MAPLPVESCKAILIQRTGVWHVRSPLIICCSSWDSFFHSVLQHRHINPGLCYTRDSRDRRHRYRGDHDCHIHEYNCLRVRRLARLTILCWHCINSFTTSVNGQVNDAGTFNVPTNKTCQITVRTRILLPCSFPTMTDSSQYDMTTCDVTGSGQVRYVAAGWIWFQYDDQVGWPQYIS